MCISDAIFFLFVCCTDFLPNFHDILYLYEILMISVLGNK